MKWDEWRGSLDGRPAMWIKGLLYFFGRRIDLHKVVRPDDVDCFHTHPGYCFRFILWGGYIEELWGGKKVTWRPGSFGIVPPELCHRFDSLLKESSYSLWIRGKVRAKVEVRGSGWPQGADTQSRSHLDSKEA